VEDEADGIDRGTPGASARREYERRSERRSAEVRVKHPRVGKAMLAVTSEPQSTRAWSIGADGEAKIGARLETFIGDRGVVLHDRARPRGRGNIDHLVIGPAGVFVVDAKSYRGKVERRMVGPLFDRSPALFIAGRNQTKLVEGAQRQLADVRACVGSRAPCRAALCLTRVEWPALVGPFSIGDVWVGWAKKAGEARASGRCPVARPDRVDRPYVVGALSERVKCGASPWRPGGNCSDRGTPEAGESGRDATVLSFGNP
jgi:hypothetical protein